MGIKKEYRGRDKSASISSSSPIELELHSAPASACHFDSASQFDFLPLLARKPSRSTSSVPAFPHPPVGRLRSAIDFEQRRKSKVLCRADRVRRVLPPARNFINRGKLFSLLDRMHNKENKEEEGTRGKGYCAARSGVRFHGGCDEYNRSIERVNRRASERAMANSFTPVDETFDYITPATIEASCRKRGGKRGSRVAPAFDIPRETSSLN